MVLPCPWRIRGYLRVEGGGEAGPRSDEAAAPVAYGLAVALGGAGGHVGGTGPGFWLGQSPPRGGNALLVGSLELFDLGLDPASSARRSGQGGESGCQRQAPGRKRKAKSRATRNADRHRQSAIQGDASTKSSCFSRRRRPPASPRRADINTHRRLYLARTGAGLTTGGKAPPGAPAPGRGPSGTAGNGDWAASPLPRAWSTGMGARQQPGKPGRPGRGDGAGSHRRKSFTWTSKPLRPFGKSSKPPDGPPIPPGGASMWGSRPASRARPGNDFLEQFQPDAAGTGIGREQSAWPGAAGSPGG